ncbi:MAG TPA: tryptophan synthase subunit alpha [Spirochaetia bacterium]|nr:tryptophan synthase subunit alpha [Spirochaetia bacterium]
MSSAPRIMAHLVAGFPNREASIDVARGLADGGCAYLEVQFPFSDPTADGPDIQRACAAALDAGFTVGEGFQIIAEIRRGVSVPIFVMSYANLLFTRGIRGFLRSAAAAGARGMIVPDLPPDYDEGLFEEAKAAGLAAVPVVSPSMRPERLERIGALRPEWIYATLRIGTTGACTAIDQPGLSFLERVRAVSSGQAKVLGGFGISTAAQVSALAPRVHAVVIGSAFVREVVAGGDVYARLRAKMEELAGLQTRLTG